MKRLILNNRGGFCLIIGDKVMDYEEDIVRDLCDLIKIRSIADLPSKGNPAGKKVGEALEYMLSLGDKLGFKTRNVDGYAGHVEYGEGEEIAGILVHLDVVPEGTGWTLPPFEGIIQGGKIYGRGASDDKGPAVVAIYGLKVLKDLGVIPRRRIRIIFGTSEETGMKDLEYYFQKEPVPDLGFSPDAGYPIINREKGILHLKLVKPWKNSSEADHRISEADHRIKDKNILLEIKGGDAVNMVPSICTANIQANFVEPEDIVHIQRFAEEFNTKDAKEKMRGKVHVEYDKDNGLRITAKGKSAHGASPAEGINAIYSLLEFMFMVKDKGVIGDNIISTFAADEFLKFIYEKEIGFDGTGSGLKIDLEDEESGPLTLNLGKINYNREEKEILLDIRYPVTLDYKEIIETIKEQTTKADIEIEVIEHKLPLYVPESSPIIEKLSKAYEKITGEKAELISIGGGTYARALKNNGVAFGGAGEGAHQPDENVSIKELMHHAKICTQAIYEIAL